MWFLVFVALLFSRSFFTFLLGRGYGTYVMSKNIIRNRREIHRRVFIRLEMFEAIFG